MAAQEQFMQNEKDFHALPFVVDVLAKESQDEGAAARRSLEKEKARIEKAVETIVDKHFVGFNSSVKAFSTIFSEYLQAQKATTKLKRQIADTQRTLLQRKRNLKELEFSKMQHAHFLRMLGELEEVSTAPCDIDALLARREYVACVERLQKALTSSFGEELGEVGALIDVREDILARKQSVQDALVEDLLAFLRDTSTATDAPSAAQRASLLSDLTSALALLNRLPAAERAVRERLALELREVTEAHLRLYGEAAGSRGEIAEPGPSPWGGYGSSGARGLTARLADERLRAMVHSLLHDFSAILRNHALVVPELAARGNTQYSLAETWCAMQV